jgi:hypothetical protein
MVSERLINRFEESLTELAEISGSKEKTSIITNLEVIDAAPAGLTDYIIIEDSKDGDYITAVKVPGVTYSNGDLVNVLFIDGAEPIAYQQGTGSTGVGAAVDRIYDSAFSSLAGQSDASADFAWTGNVTAVGISQALHHPYNLTGDATESEHWEDNDASFPAGWTETDAAADTDTDSTYSFWYIQGSSAEVSWDYRRQTAVDLEVDTTTNLRIEIGPLYFQDAGYSADIDYYFGVYRDNAGIDVDTFTRVHLQWDSAGSQWRIRGELKDSSSGTQKNGTWLVFTNPLHIPIWLSVQIANTTNRGITFISTWPPSITPGLSGTFLQNATPTTVLDYNNVWLRFHQTRGAGGNDRLFMDALNFLIN